MAAFFLDSSAVVKRYVNENGTEFINGLVRPKEKNAIFVSQIARVEVASAIARRNRGKDLTDADAATALRSFSRDLEDIYFTIEISEGVITSAADLAIKYALRGYDAVQLATALAANYDVIAGIGESLTFVSADGSLNSAAAAEGFDVEDPNDHA